MKIVTVQTTTVVIPEYSSAGYLRRVVLLRPRVLNGRQAMAAYVREIDTLYVQATS